MLSHDRWMLSTQSSQTDLSTQHSHVNAWDSVQHPQGATNSHMQSATIEMESKLPKQQHVVKAGQAVR